MPLEDADPTSQGGSILQVTAETFERAMHIVRRSNEKTREATSAGGRFINLRISAVRNYFFYAAPHIAIAGEELDPEAIELVYGRLSWVTATTPRLMRRVNFASRLHDLALSAVALTVGERLERLHEAERAYHEVVYGEDTDPAVRTGQVSVGGTDSSRRTALFSGDYVLSARLALACMPISEARIRSGRLNPEARAELEREARLRSHQNLGVVIGEMIPGDSLPPLPATALVRAYSNLSEAMGPTLLSRENEEVDTAIALSVSEARRQRGGPDAAVLFTGDAGARELDVDWKLRISSAVSRSPHSDNVIIGMTCLREIGSMRTPPELRAASGLHDELGFVCSALLYAAQLLRDEATGRRQLTDEETRYLNRVQRSVWGRIDTIARNRGITDLRQRARF
jgi:hypothetical protein